MADLGFELEEIARLLELVESRDLNELIVKDGGRRIHIRGASYTHKMRNMIPTDILPSVVTQNRGQLPPASVSTLSDNRKVVESPMIGVFYRAAGPDSPSFVDVGDHVTVGQTIGMMEAMKVFSEIPSEVEGIVAEICAENGQLVHTGEPLLYLNLD